MIYVSTCMQTFPSLGPSSHKAVDGWGWGSLGSEEPPPPQRKNGPPKGLLECITNRMYEKVHRMYKKVH